MWRWETSAGRRSCFVLALATSALRFFKDMKKQIGSKKLLFSFVLIACTFILLSFFYQNILAGAGRFLAPEGVGRADVVILESTELVRDEAVRIGVRLLSSGKVNCLVVVYQNAENEKIFGRPLNYDLFLTQELEHLGLKKDQIQVIGVPKEHPITLTEAQIVLSNLSGNGVKSAILLTESFHARRSYWTYKQVGSPLGIEIIPFPYFMNYHNETWWQNSQGIREFLEESLKFLYYLLRGYVPLKSLVEV